MSRERGKYLVELYKKNCRDHEKVDINCKQCDETCERGKSVF